MKLKVEPISNKLCTMCIAETEEEADLLIEFMKRTNHLQKEEWSVLDSDNYPFCENDKDYYIYDNYNEALDTAKDWCHGEDNNEYYVDILRNGIPFERVRVIKEYKESVIRL